MDVTERVREVCRLLREATASPVDAATMMVALDYARHELSEAIGLVEAEVVIELARRPKEHG